MSWLLDALNSVVLAGRRTRRASGDALGDAQLPDWLER